MTTSGDLLLTWARRVRANWPALLLPLVAAGTTGLLGGPLPRNLTILAAIVAVAAPAVGAKISPFALIGYGAYGLFKLHSLEIYESMPVRYGLVTAARIVVPIPGGVQLTSRTTGFAPMLAEAMLFLIAGVCLLAVSGAPGGGAIRRAVAQLRGSDGQPRTAPPLLLIPVIFLCEELFSPHLWYAAEAAPGVFAALAFAAGVALIIWRPRAAAAIALVGLLLLGLYGVSWGVYLLSNAGNGYGSIDDSPWYGAVLLNGDPAELFAGLQGLALLGVGAALAPRLLSWGADHRLAERAQALASRVDRLTMTRAGASEVAIAELRRIERDLHDGAQARLVAVGMSLRAAEQLMPTSPDAALALVAEARQTSSRALADLRDLVRGIYPPVLADRGLADAVRALALDTPLPVDVDVNVPEEPPMPVAAAVYFGIAEAITNAVVHAGATSVLVQVAHSGDMLRALVTDDGHGGADPSLGTGLAGVERRLAAFDGILAVSSPAGGPTIVAIEVPCALSSAKTFSS